MGRETEQQIISSNPKLEMKSRKGGFALSLSSSLLLKFNLRKSSGFSFPTTNAREICNDECLGSWQCYSLETIKCWNLFSQPYDFCWPETYKEAGRHQKKAWGCCRWPGPSGSPVDSKPVQQTGCGTPKSSQHLHILNHAGLNTNPSSSEMPSAPREQLKPNHMQLSVWSLRKQVLILC